MVVSRYEDDVYSLLREQRPHGCARIMKHIDRVQYAHPCTLDDTLVTLVLSERGMRRTQSRNRATDESRL